MCCRVDLDDLIESGHAEGLLQVLQGAFRFSILLDEQIIQNVLVTLNQALRVLLAMLQLLVAVTLDALEESSESKLLLVAQLGLLLLDHGLHLYTGKVILMMSAYVPSSHK